nr:hypothetical protein [Tanacetum cinerariifolium]
MLVQNLMGEGSAIPTYPQHTPTILPSSSSQPQKTQKPRKPKRKDTQVSQLNVPTESFADEVVYKELDDRLFPRNYFRWWSSCQEAIGDTIAQTWFENVSKLSNDLLLVRGNILRSKEDIMKLNELMKLCTNLQTRVHDLEKTKSTQALEITSLKRRVKKLKKEQSLGEDASKQGKKINVIDADDDIILVNDQDDAKMFDVNDLHGEKCLLKKKLLIKRLVLLKSQDKGKAILIEEPVKPKKKVQHMIDEETAKNLQDEFDEEERIAREKAEKELEANIALIEE